MKTGYVLGFSFSPDKKRVALIRKTVPEWQRGKLNGIGGKIIFGEDPLDAMIREFREEAGPTITNWKYFAVLEGGNFQVVCYSSFQEYSYGEFLKPHNTTETDGSKEVIMSVEVDAIRWSETIPNLRWLIPLALDPDRISTVTTYFSK